MLLGRCLIVCPDEPHDFFSAATNPNTTMSVNSLSETNIDETMRRIRGEVARNKQKKPSAPTEAIKVKNSSAPSTTASAPEPLRTSRFTVKPEYRVEDFLAFEDEEFLQNAYLGILGRDVDDSGRKLFLDPLKVKKLSKIELLARLRYSAEGRSKKVPIRSRLAARGLAKASFRIPVVGYVFALANYLVKLPVIANNLETLQSDLRLEREHNSGVLSAVETQVTGSLKTVQNQMSKKVDKEPFWKLSNQLIEKDEFWAAINQKVDKRVFDTEIKRTAQEYWTSINQKVDKRVFDTEIKRTAHEFWQALNGKVDKQLYFRSNTQLTDALAGVRSEQQELFRKHQEQKVTLLDQQRRLVLLLEEARKRMPEPFAQDQVASIAAVADHWLDAHYLSFEDVFRGTREDIKERAQVYLPIMRSANAGSEERPVIDLGCGRGELLELLKDNGLTARGIDQNQILIQQCGDAGLEVIEADAIDYLEHLPAASVGAVTGLHIVEHIPFDRLVRLLDESLRVLKPGGVVAFETPNPENLMVGACNFYYDPTHLHPLPPPVSQFLLEARGFVRVEVKRLTENRSVETLPLAPLDQPDSESLNRVVEFINRHFGAAPDYAVIGYKA